MPRAHADEHISHKDDYMGTGVDTLNWNIDTRSPSCCSLSKHKLETP
jgi:hypothetical protein